MLVFHVVAVDVILTPTVTVVVLCIHLLLFNIIPIATLRALDRARQDNNKYSFGEINSIQAELPKIMSSSCIVHLNALNINTADFDAEVKFT